MVVDFQRIRPPPAAFRGTIRSEVAGVTGPVECTGSVQTNCKQTLGNSGSFSTWSMVTTPVDATGVVGGCWDCFGTALAEKSRRALNGALPSAKGVLLLQGRMEHAVGGTNEVAAKKSAYTS